MGNVQCCNAENVTIQDQKIIQSEFQLKKDDINASQIMMFAFNPVKELVQNQFVPDFKKQKNIQKFIGINVENLAEFYQLLTQIRNQDKKINSNEQKNPLQTKERYNLENQSLSSSRTNLTSAKLTNERIIDDVKQALFELKKNTRKNIRNLQVSNIKRTQNQLEAPYFLPWLAVQSSFTSVYIGQWRYHLGLDRNIPFGIGRLYFQKQIWQGEIQTLPVKQFDLDQLCQNLNSKGTSIRNKIQLFGSHFEIFLNGIGRQFNKDQEYIGTFIKNKLNGKGQYKNFPLQYAYEGYWKDNMKQGKGTQKTKFTQYEGDFKQNKKTGYGTLLFFISPELQKKRQAQQKLVQNSMKHNNKQFAARKSRINTEMDLQKMTEILLKNTLVRQINSYKGLQLQRKEQQIPKNQTFVANMKFQQQFRKFFLQKYTGEFSNDLFHGQGTYIWFKGNFYCGQWSQGKMSGFGRFYWKQGYSYCGQYKNDLKHGKGQMLWSPYARYRGCWAFGMRHGYGQLIQIKRQQEKLGVYIRSSLWNRKNQQKVYFQRFISFEEQLPQWPILLKNLKYYTSEKLNETDQFQIVKRDAQNYFQCSYCEQYFQKDKNINILSNIANTFSNQNEEQIKQVYVCSKCKECIARLEMDKSIKTDKK